MGTKLSNLLITKEITIHSLMNKKLAVDAYNQLYQYLSTIRQSDGSPLKNSKGKITSHISGLFFRTVNLMEKGIKLAFIYDGVAPDLKKKEKDRRRAIKEEAVKLYEKATKDQDIESMNKYAKRTSRLTSEMIEESKELLSALGIPHFTAPSEGEAQAAYMVKKGEFYGIISQDTDSLLFGATRVIKNLTISKKKRFPGSPAYKKNEPEIINLKDNLNNLGIDIEQLIALSMLVGTDFNIGGIKGIGPKKGITLIKEYKNNFEELFKEVKWNEYFDYPWTDVYYTIKNMPVQEEYSLKWNPPNINKVKEILVDKFEFSENRIESTIKKINISQSQKGLGDFF
ncbi:flap endonuclease-1 [archaeon]|nr:flap endonuclease-1 [archaeon]